MLRRIKGDDLAGDLGVEQPQPDGTARPRLDRGRVEPAREAVAGGHQREDDFTRRVDLRLQLDSSVHADTIPRHKV